MTGWPARWRPRSERAQRLAGRVVDGLLIAAGVAFVVGMLVLAGVTG